MSQKVRATITKIMVDRIEARREAIESGAEVLPWRKSWNGESGAPRNLVSGKAYRGFNVFMCMFSPFSSPYWATVRQIKALGGHIRKGESYTPIVFWKFPTKEDKAAGKDFDLCRFYKVRNVEQ